MKNVAKHLQDIDDVFVRVDDFIKPGEMSRKDADYVRRQLLSAAASTDRIRATLGLPVE